MPRQGCTAIAIALALSACGTGRDVAFVVELEGEARAAEVHLRIDDDTRLYEDVEHGRRIVKRDLMDGTQVELRAINGGDTGALVLRAFVDDCAAGTARCDEAGCTAELDLEVREVCD